MIEAYLQSEPKPRPNRDQNRDRIFLPMKWTCAMISAHQAH